MPEGKLLGSLRSIRLLPVLETCISTQASVSVRAIGSTSRKIIFRVSDIYENYFLANFDDTFQKKELLAKILGHDSDSLEILIKHKNQSLVFSTQLRNSCEVMGALKQGEDLAETSFTFTFPETGHFRNQRKKPRCKFLNANELSLQGQVIVKSTFGHEQFSTFHFEDISQQGISLYLPRAQGLVYRGDRVESFRLEKSGREIFHSSGEIKRIDLGQNAPEVEESYLMAFEFDPRDTSQSLAYHELLDPQWDQLGTLTVVGEHPFLPGQKIQGELMGLNPPYFSCLVGKCLAPLLPGLHCGEMTLKLGEQGRHPLSFQILKLQELHGEHSSCYKIDCVISEPSPQLTQTLNELLLRAEFKRAGKIREGGNANFWDFAFHTGHVHYGKKKQFQHTFQEIKKNQKLLTSSKIYKEKSQNGQALALKVFDHAWIYQGEAGSHFEQVTEDLAQLDLLHTPQYILCACDRNSPQLEQELTSMEAKEKNQKKLISGQHFQMCVLKESVVKGEVNLVMPEQKILRAKIKTREATPSDLVELEKLLFESGEMAAPRVEGVTRYGAAQLQIEDDYHNLGLMRKRKVFLSEGGRGFQKVFAVCNYTSVGISPHELGNSFRYYYSDLSGPENLDLMEALTAKVIQSYWETSIKSPLALIRPGEVIPSTLNYLKKLSLWSLLTPLFQSSECSRSSQSNETPEFGAKVKQSTPLKIAKKGFENE